MSGIVGIYYRDGRLVNPDDLTRMVDTIAHRGPDGSDIWHAGPIGFGHRMLWTTPESINEKLPYYRSDCNLAITSDARIDNRHELLDTLGIKVNSDTWITDSELILEAYLKWGEQTPEKLDGDFAFVIWDGRKQTLLCFRDHTGMKPFYYYLEDNIFIFATEIKALLKLKEIKACLNETRIGEYLLALTPDMTSTFYKGVLRLAPANVLIINQSISLVKCYWRLNPEYELRLGSDSAYFDEFHNLFTRAVQNRLRSYGAIGVELSGGLDSSAVTCIASNLLIKKNNNPKLHAFSAIFDATPECDERPYISEVLKHRRIEKHYIASDHYSQFSYLDEMLENNDEPFMAPGLILSRIILGNAAKVGIRIMLDGEDGDGTVSHGFRHLDELVSAKRWIPLALNLYGVSITTGESLFNLTSLYSIAIAKEILKTNSITTPFLNKLIKLCLSIFSDFVRMRMKKPESELNCAIYSDFLNNMGFADRLKEQNRIMQAIPTERESHYQNISSGVRTSSIELLNHIAGAFGIEIRHPFYDKTLLEFCLSLPADLKLRNGWSRYIMRQSLKDILPKKIAMRRTKANFYPYLFNGFLKYERQRIEKLFTHNFNFVQQYINLTTLKNYYNNLLTGGQPSNYIDYYLFTRVVILETWLISKGIST